MSFSPCFSLTLLSFFFFTGYHVKSIYHWKDIKLIVHCEGIVNFGSPDSKEPYSVLFVLTCVCVCVYKQSQDTLLTVWQILKFGDQVDRVKGECVSEFLIYFVSFFLPIGVFFRANKVRIKFQFSFY